MMKLFYTIAALLLFAHSLFSQTTFVGHLGGYDSEVPNAMITDHSGNIIICGVFDDVIDFDMSAGVFQLTSINFYSGFIAKYNSSGGLIWAKQFGTLITSVETDESDNIYALGSLEGTKDVDPSAATFNLTSNGLHDGALIKLDPSGHLVSAIKIGGIDDDGFASIKANDAGAIYVTGGFMNTVDFDPSGAVFNLTPSNMGTFYFCNTGFIAKYDYNFNFIWAKRIASSGLLTLHKGDPGNEYFLLSTVGVSAMSTDSADFDPSSTNFVSPVPDPLPEAHWMGHIRYTDNGDYVWSKFYRTFGSLGGSSLGIYDVELDADQNIYFTGSYILPFTAYPDNDISLEPFVLYTGQPDGFLIKTDAAANLVWQKRFGSAYGADYGSDLVLDNAGNIHLTGGFHDVAEFNEGSTPQKLTSAGEYDMFAAGYAGNGSFLYKGQVGSAGSDAGFKITATGGKIALTGIFANTADCDPFTGTTNLTSLGYQDIFFTLYNNSYAGSCAVPVNVTATGVTTDAAKIGWNTVVNATLYKVQYKTSTSGTWLTASSNSSPCTLSGLFPGTTYDYRVQAVCNSGPAGYSATQQFFTLGTGYCVSKGLNASKEWIDYVELAGLINNTPSNDGGYADYTNLSADLIQGSTQSITLSAGMTGTHKEVWRVWIDYNNDGDFSDNGEKEVSYKSSQTSLETHTFAVKANAIPGNTKMRVSMKRGNPDQTSCEVFSFGEVEDYTVNILPARSGSDFGNQAANKGLITHPLILYPNPATSLLYVDLNGFEGKVSLKVFDLAGKLISAVTTATAVAQLDVHSLPQGMYILQVTNEAGNVETANWIKQ